MESNIKDKVVFASPKTEEDRAFIAGACVRKLGIKFPAVLDEFGNSTEQAYTGWPDRIYLIDSQGHIAYKSKPGPFGFKPDQLETALSRALPISVRSKKGTFVWNQRLLVPSTTSLMGYLPLPAQFEFNHWR
jgi:type I thyroxine 5'-deiodinase